MESPEGKGIARRAWESYVGAVEKLTETAPVKAGIENTDGGALVQRLYGHPSERLARERIKRAVGGRSRDVVELSEASRRHTS